MPPEKKERYRVRIKEPTRICPQDQEPFNAAPGEVHEVAPEDCYNLTASGKADIVDDKTPTTAEAARAVEKARK